MIQSAKKDQQVISADWQQTKETIQGVAIREVLHVPRDHGTITEVFRSEWDPTGLPVEKTVDRLFVNQGSLKVVLYDGREDSPTYKMINEIHVGDARPAFIVIPTGIWHGLQNLGNSDALVLNLPTTAYDYRDPDRWRLPYDTDEIPYKWSDRGTT